MGKVQPHCMVCRQPIRKDDMVQVDKLFDQITHFYCYHLDKADIKEVGLYQNIVAAHPKYKRAFIV